jgi:hypothetical protein
MTYSAQGVGSPYIDSVRSQWVKAQRPKKDLNLPDFLRWS